MNIMEIDQNGSALEVLSHSDAVDRRIGLDVGGGGLEVQRVAA